MNRNTARTMSAMTPASIPLAPLLLADERRGAPDLHHVHALAGLDHVVLVVGPRGPVLALELDAARPLVVRDPLGDGRGPADERRGARAQLWRHPLVRPCDRPQRA